MDIVQAILYKYPSANPLTDFAVYDNTDGNGPYLKTWSLSGDMPSNETLEIWWNQYQETVKG